MLPPPLQEAILDVLLQRINMGAILSLEALLPLVVAFVRDLQQEAVAYLPRITAAMADLVNAGEPISCGATLLVQSGAAGRALLLKLVGCDIKVCQAGSLLVSLSLVVHAAASGVGCGCVAGFKRVGFHCNAR